MTLRKSATTEPGSQIPRSQQASLPIRGGRPARMIPEDVVKPWKLPAQRTYIFKNANVVEPSDGSILPNATVKISAGLIHSISSSSRNSSDLGPPDAEATDEDSTVIDLDGKYLCPGLIDSHVHISAVPGSDSLDNREAGDDTAVSLLRQPYVCAQMLSRGFTTARDCGGATLALQEALADDVFPGPRLFFAGHALSQTGGHGDKRGRHDLGRRHCPGEELPGLSVVCDGVTECVRAAREQLRTGADFIKIMVGGGVASPADRLENTQFTSAEVRAVCEVAASYGTWVTAHAYTPRAIRHAVDNGVGGIEHGNFLDRDTAELMARKGVWLTPTLVAYDAMASDKYAGFLPPDNQEKNREVLARGLASLRVAADAGVNMCYGSDLLGPLTAEESREFAIRARVLSSAQVLQCATVNGARMLRREGFLGRVREGFAADLLVLNANPLEDVTILDRPELHLLAVIKNGRVCSSRWSKLPTDVGRPQVLIE